mmetsp:Transcript_20451/g.28724  ORF Transcript_20451/g.28724 Transcript_20451/m.28724 type:complete len:82 (-) Transcript_20451:168-413(-)
MALTSVRVFTCSLTTPKVRNPSQASPPASPNLLVSANAMPSGAVSSSDTVFFSFGRFTTVDVVGASLSSQLTIVLPGWGLL